MSDEPVNTDTSVPIQMSMGGVNCYYHHCDVLASRRNYASCLNTLDAVKRGVKIYEKACVKAIGYGCCPAAALRKTEEDAGHALYFKHRDVQMAERAAESAAMQGQIRYGASNRASLRKPISIQTAIIPRTPEPKSTPSNKNKTSLDVGILNRNHTADAINAAIAKE